MKIDTNNDNVEEDCRKQFQSPGQNFPWTQKMKIKSRTEKMLIGRKDTFEKTCE
jgi:hypothetical protein